MREQLEQYVRLLFAGTPDSEDMQQEILQNTLDRYDDLIGQGKTPEAAYRLAISGIGDVSEILGSTPSPAQPATPRSSQPTPKQAAERPLWKRILLAISIALYIISIIPLIVLSEMGMDVLGLCGMISIVAVATVAIIVASGGSKEEKREAKEPQGPRQELREAVKKTLSTVALVLFLVVSFATGAWYITWLIFPIMAAVRGIVFACMDLKEAGKYES